MDAKHPLTYAEQERAAGRFPDIRIILHRGAFRLTDGCGNMLDCKPLASRMQAEDERSRIVAESGRAPPAGERRGGYR